MYKAKCHRKFLPPFFQPTHAQKSTHLTFIYLINVKGKNKMFWPYTYFIFEKKIKIYKKYFILKILLF